LIGWQLTCDNSLPFQAAQSFITASAVNLDNKMKRIPRYARKLCKYNIFQPLYCRPPSNPLLKSIPVNHTPRRTIASSPSSQWTSVPRKFPVSGFELLDTNIEIEEETLPTYQPEKYYPVQQGEILNDRYQTIAKVGYGVTSTVWFGRDLLSSKYVVLKVYVAGQHRHRELGIYEHFNCIETKHPGKKWIRLLIDHFVIKGPHSSHICLVHEPLGITADYVMKFMPNRSMDLESMKRCLRQLLVSLDFLHCQAKVVHTVDIWSAAMVAWDIVSPRTLFDGRNADGIFDDRVHLAEMIALLGPPPPEFRACHKLSSVFWDDDGNWKDLAPIPEITVEKLGADIEGEDKEGFFRWIRSVLQWNPEDRPTAEEMVYDEWCIRGIKVQQKEQNTHAKS
ncbi:uncharacterized protein TRUGW13939_02300, partial [Talaromyces rugulosus]